MDRLAVSPRNQVVISDITNEQITSQNIGELSAYLALAENPHQNVGREGASALLAKLSYGMRRATELYSAAVYYLTIAEGSLEEAEGTAALDRFYAFVDAKKASGIEMKVTEELRKAYVKTDSEVLAGIERVAAMKGLVIQFKGMANELNMRLSSIKAAAYGYKDEASLSGAASSAGEDQ